jgi:hypothetical protein
MQSHTIGGTVLMLMCGVLFAGNASAITVETWTSFDLPFQQVYVLGVLDAWLNLEQTRTEGAKTAGVPESQVRPSVISRLVNCMSKRYTFEQVDKMVGNYVAQHLHEQKHLGMASVIWTAVNEACNKPEQKGK